jgi:hypothetical protein
LRGIGDCNLVVLMISLVTTARPRTWLALGVSATIAVHAIALLMVAAPAIPTLRTSTGLRAALPGLRVLALVAGASACVALLALAYARRISWRRALVAVSLLSALLAIGSLYGCSEHTRVTARPISTATTPRGETAFDHKAFDVVLARFVDEHGMVDYRGLVASRVLLDEYVGQLATASPRSHPQLFPTKAHAMAYWINAYNALAMRAVIDHYPVRSVSDIMVAHGVFNRLHFPVGGTDMTLDDIEKGILLRELDDPRVHFALTCASMSCPRLDQRAFHADDLSDRLAAKGRVFLQSRDGIVIDTQRGLVRMSKYFDWYADDFGADHLAFVRPYLSAEQRASLARIDNPRIEHMEYDWRLNDQSAPWRSR